MLLSSTLLILFDVDMAVIVVEICCLLMLTVVDIFLCLFDIANDDNVVVFTCFMLLAVVVLCC